ncbi:MAG: GNAT family N-acetyltransferase [Salibacteraceae bacterium]
MKVISVKNKSEVESFLQLPYSIYASDKHWVPHLKQDIEAVFDRKQNKLWRHGEAVRWILINENGECIGRIAAFINRKSTESNGQPTGGCGFFECIDDQQAANFLFDTAKNWLEDKGMRAMDGPINFGEKNKFWGLITENFEMPPYYGQNYNPAYYVALFENYGFQVYYNQLIYYRSVNDPLQQRFNDRAERLIADPDYRCIHIDKRQLEKYAEDFRTVYNRAWVTHDSFKGMSVEQSRSIMKRLKPVLDEKLIWFAYYKDKPVGFYISLPELNEIFKEVGDNLNWWGKLKFLFYKYTKKRVNSFGVAFGIDPDHQGKGMEGFIFKHMENVIQKQRLYEGIIITWIGDFNPKMIAIIEALGGKKIRQMATYRYLFDRTAKFERSPIINGK